MKPSNEQIQRKLRQNLDDKTEDLAGVDPLSEEGISFKSSETERY